MATAALTYGYRDERGMRYVGKTASTLRYRDAHHAHEARRGTRRHFYNWWRSLSYRPCPVLLGVHPTNADALDTEREIIALCRAMGEPLTNHTDGGEGVVGLRHTPEARARMSAAQRARTKQPHEGHRHSEEARQRISEAGRGRAPWNKGKQVWSEEERREIGARQTGRKHSDATRAKMGAARSGEANGLSKLTADIVREMRARAAAGETGKDLADEYGVSHTAACRAISGRTWGVV